MKVTFILKDLTETFYNGNGSSIVGLLNQSDKDKFSYLTSSNAKDLSITCKIGNGWFQERVELNQLIRNNPNYSFKLEPRRGYKLATFEINN